MAAEGRSHTVELRLTMAAGDAELLLGRWQSIFDGLTAVRRAGEVLLAMPSVRAEPGDDGEVAVVLTWVEVQARDGFDALQQASGLVAEITKTFPALVDAPLKATVSADERERF